MTERNYVISVSEPSVSLQALVRQLEEAGVKVTQALPAAGVVLGAADEAIVEALRALPGVGAVEEERPYQLPPSERGHT